MPALKPLIPRLVGIAVLAVAFVGLTIAITAGAVDALDLRVGRAMHDVWRESLHGLFQAIAELGGLELTGVLMVTLLVYMWRARFGSDSLVVIAFAGAVFLEIMYKYLLYHPGPPHSLSHSDGPSLTTLVAGSGALGSNSFPSGHIVRAVVAYGLLAFVIRRLTTSPLLRKAAGPVAFLLVLLVAFDRLYLDVHWESDVVGGLLLGAIALLAATVWLDRPRKAEN
ncbi:MAG TPA: phosphatase PAP2 family protein [Candidatus Dormibacteraeota bacterium]